MQNLQFLHETSQIIEASHNRSIDSNFEKCPKVQFQKGFDAPITTDNMKIFYKKSN